MSVTFHAPTTALTTTQTAGTSFENIHSITIALDTINLSNQPTSSGDLSTRVGTPTSEVKSYIFSTLSYFEGDEIYEGDEGDEGDEDMNEESSLSSLSYIPLAWEDPPILDQPEESSRALKKQCLEHTPDTN